MPHVEFAKLFEATRSRSWKLLFALTRLAALRRGEALELCWTNIDWGNSRLTVISRDDWEVKDKQPRIVPICPELHALLLQAFDQAVEGETKVIPGGSVNVKNIWRDFGVVCGRAGVARYAKPFHSLRKSGINDWAARFPAHVVLEWAGHSDMETTATYYLKVSEADYEKAVYTPTAAEATQKVTQLDGSEPPNERKSIAGDRIRTDDVQLGKLAFYH